MKNTLLILVLFCAGFSLSYGQVLCITFDYDASGNRIERLVSSECDDHNIKSKDTTVVADMAYALSDAQDSLRGRADSLNEEGASLLSDVQLSNRFDAVKLYPNPVADVLHVQQHIAEFAKANIYFSDGRMVQAGIDVTANSQINLAGLAKGIYLFELIFEDQESIKFKIEKL